MSTSITGPGQATGSGYRLEAENEARPQRRGETRAAPTNTVTIDTRPLHLGPLRSGSIRQRNHRRRWRLASLVLAIAMATAVVGGYLYGYASDQYVTEFRFSVRRQAPLRMDPTSGSSLSSSLSGASASLAVIADSQIVIQYMKSRQIVDDITASGVDLDAIYARSGADPVARLSLGASAEERQRYWRRMVDPFFDLTTGIVSVEVRAFSPIDAKLVATKTLALAEKLVNDLSDRAHTDTVSYAGLEADASEAKLKSSQVAISDYRNKNAVLFPEMQATADTNLEGHIQDSLIDAKTTYSSALAQGVSKDAQHMRILQDRIVALQSELPGVHGRMAKSGTGATSDASLASVLSGYGVLQVEEEIAAKVYERALIALQDAKNEANQQSVYLAAFVRPALPEDSMYPIRWRIMLETALIGFAGWCLLQLLYHGIRDHID